MAHPKPAITFQVNTETLNRQGFLVPNNIQLHGNETVSEANDQKYHRSLAFVPGLNAGMNITGWSHGQQFTLYGSNALYVQKTYCPGKPSDILSVVSISYADSAVQ